jgi:hypothetical protein
VWSVVFVFAFHCFLLGYWFGAYASSPVYWMPLAIRRRVSLARSWAHIHILERSEMQYWSSVVNIDLMSFEAASVVCGSIVTLAGPLVFGTRRIFGRLPLRPQ